MTEQRDDRLRRRFRGQRQLVVGTVGLTVLSAAGVGVVASAAAHDFANKDQLSVPSGAQESDAPTDPRNRQQQSLPNVPGPAPAPSSAPIAPPVVPPAANSGIGPGTSSGVAPVAPTRQRARARSAGS